MKHVLHSSSMLVALICSTVAGAGEVGLSPLTTGTVPCEVGDHAGLLGKTYVRGAYSHIGVDDPIIELFDDSLQGAEAEFNTPIPFLTSDSIGVDYFAEYEFLALDGGPLELDGHTGNIGTRVFGKSMGRIRPYVALGITFNRSNVRVGGFQRGSSDEGLLLDLGAEFDVNENISIRPEFHLGKNYFEDPEFEGNVILWASERVFVTGGVYVPFGPDADIGGQVGGGIRF